MLLAEEKRLDEKKRRQAQLEREKRIQEQLNKESQANTVSAKLHRLGSLLNKGTFYSLPMEHQLGVQFWTGTPLNVLTLNIKLETCLYI